ncbi:hypothetical protein BLOT_008489 [Blomia tropicalis]|nr:hypothetical protein BLOT_008489 [Blomia tropicalis]
MFCKLNVLMEVISICYKGKREWDPISVPSCKICFIYVQVSCRFMSIEFCYSQYLWNTFTHLSTFREYGQGRRPESIRDKSI